MKLPDAAARLYPAETLPAQEARYENGSRAFTERFQKEPQILLSSSGRTEILGNHTDHNGGRAVGAAVNLDLIAFLSPRSDGRICLHSEGYTPWEFSISDTAPRAEEVGKSIALVRGIVSEMLRLSHPVVGFDCYMTSQIPGGGGLSSSAAFAVGMITALNALTGAGALTPVEKATLAQSAENRYFGKNCGLLDQLSCAVGGAVALDFQNSQAPSVVPLSLSLSSLGYAMVVTDTLSDHADLTADYAAIRGEMEQIAAHFGQKNLRGVSPDAFWDEISLLRKKYSSRALLRTAHFFDENERVDAMTRAIREKDMSRYLALVEESGLSSERYLQNVYSVSDPTHQPVSFALCLARRALCGKGACRIHGGGFGGTIQAYVPLSELDAYLRKMDSVFGSGTSYPLQIRPVGAVSF